ncbi:trifunctional purine biosynthetic protein adenosine-3 isoform X2 [Agrilus planipennis]|nr:trifunctional purine biosynthetic protein adenosine-3 isoform X2 [Agrilus planipennis]
MDKYSIPTARWQSFTNADKAKQFIKSADFLALVVKASGLAAGKGVVVAENVQEACKAVDEIITAKKYGEAGETVVIEELLVGEEVSVLAFTDGTTVRPLLPAQDHKKIFENDLGPNTGGMGAYCPCHLIDSDTMDFVYKNILQKTIEGFKKEKIHFVGVLYAGLILTEKGPKVLEFNCRFGDPETEVILPLLETDLLEVMVSCCQGRLHNVELKWKENLTAVGVVLASRGYPASSSKGDVITGISKVESLPNCLVFHCGTLQKDSNTFVTNGGRVLIIVSLSRDIPVAIGRALLSCSLIDFDGKQYRKDIAQKGVSRSILKQGTSTYQDSGVNIAVGNKFVDNIKPLTKATSREEVIGGLGSFGGLFDLKLTNYQHPILVSGTDGVGTKLKIAEEINVHSSIGIDLVAMCVNDILAHGAEPLFFLDYFACGHLDLKIAQEVISGIAEGCRQAGCALIGGETAEMSGMYSGDEYDLAGFTVGAVEQDKLLPKLQLIKDGDAVIGLASSGVHSNGFSLVRKTLLSSGGKFEDVAPFSSENKSFGEEFLKPTKIYVKSVLPLMKKGKVKAFAHITGGGLVENVPRILSNNYKVEIDATNWEIPPVFGWLAAVGNINEKEMLKTFNCGIGGVLIVDNKDVDEILKSFPKSESFVIGSVVQTNGSEKVHIKNFTKSMEQVMRPFIPSLILKHLQPKKRVGVLISGSGTNLQSLINATKDPTQNINAEIVVVISNKPNVDGLNRARRADIPTVIIQNKEYKTREEFDLAVHEELVKRNVDVICLAGFMRILTGEFVRKWRGRLLNIHPALLPLFKGTHAQRQALEAGVRVSGCTVHFVEENVDAGAIIAQQCVPVYPNDTEESLTERIKEAEHKLYPSALNLLVSETIKLGTDKKLYWK